MLCPRSKNHLSCQTYLCQKLVSRVMLCPHSLNQLSYQTHWCQTLHKLESKCHHFHRNHNQIIELMCAVLERIGTLSNQSRKLSDSCFLITCDALSSFCESIMLSTTAMSNSSQMKFKRFDWKLKWCLNFFQQLKFHLNHNYGHSINFTSKQEYNHINQEMITIVFRRWWQQEMYLLRTWRSRTSSSVCSPYPSLSLTSSLHIGTSDKIW